MSETQQRQKHPRLLLNIVLIILETFFIYSHPRWCPSLASEKVYFEQNNDSY